jgi:ParB/RepB/Spo0J family partition protein
MKMQQVVVELLPLAQLEPWEEVNVRRTQVKAEIDELAESIKRIGLLEPIVVQEQANGRYRIVLGQRRFYAFQQLAATDPEKFGRIPAIVKKMDRVTATIASMVENIQRRDIAARDKATACKFLLDHFGSTKAVAEELGYKSDQPVKKWLGFHAVPESIKKMVDKKQISPVEAIEISSNVADEKKAVEIAEKIVEDKMSKPEKERVIDVIREEPDLPKERIFKIADERKYQEEIHFVLPPKFAKGLTEAADEEGADPNTKAKNIVMDWIRSSKYV